MATCYRHPSVETGVSCSSCGRPICPDCMTSTPVGMRCPECSRQKTEVRTLRTMEHPPTVTYVLIAINVLAFLGSRSAPQIYNDGALFPADFQPWQIITSAFLHAEGSFGYIHILFNMLLLYQLGGMVLEPRLGPWKFAGVYFASMMTASLAVTLFAGDGTSTVGASGAAFGLMGAAAAMMRERGVNVLRTDIGSLILVNVALTLLFFRFFSVWGHLGGLAGGFLAGMLVIQLGKRRRTPWVPFAACVAIIVVAASAAIFVGTERSKRCEVQGQFVFCDSSS